MRTTVAVSSANLPALLTPAEVADILRTSKKAVYARIERGQLPGVVRLGRRILVNSGDLLSFIRQNTCAVVEVSR